GCIGYQLNSGPGGAEVASVGGTVQQYQIDVDPTRLRAYKIPLSAVVDAVVRSNRNVGGNVIEANGTWSVIRGLGLIENVHDIEHIVVGAENGVPIFVRHVASVQIGDAFRAAALVKGTEDALAGSVLIVTIPLPLAVLTAFLFMRYLGISSNIMSLAGIAIAIGVLVDAAIVVTENAFRFVEQRGVNTRNRRRVAETVLDATRLVG